MENCTRVRKTFLPQDSYVLLNIKEELPDISIYAYIKLLRKEMPLDDIWISIEN